MLGSPFFCQAFDVNKVRIQELGPTTVSVHDHVALKSKHFFLTLTNKAFENYSIVDSGYTAGSVEK